MAGRAPLSLATLACSAFGAAVLASALACGPAAEITGTLAVGLDAGPVDTSTTTPDAGPRPRPDGGPGSERCAEPTLTSIREKIFVPTCGAAGCHAAPTPAEGLDLTLAVPELSARLRRPSHESSSGLLLVKPGQVGASFLYLKVFLASPPFGDRMPKDRAPLEDCQLDTLRDWITAGAPD